MAELNINGRVVTVDDSFKSMSPEQQSATVEEIAATLPSQPSPQDDIKRQAGAFITGAGEAIPFAKDIAAGLKTGASYMWGNQLEGTPGERFEQAKRQQIETSRILGEEYPKTHMAGAATGIGAQLVAPELGLVKSSMSLPAKVLAGSTEGALYGLGEGVTPEERLKGAMVGAGIGAGTTSLFGAGEKAFQAAKSGAQRVRSGAAGEAEREIKEALETDVARQSERLTPEDIEFARKSGQPILPVDVGGYTLSEKLRTAADVSPEAEAAVYNPLKKRNIEQQARYEQYLQGLMGHDLNAAGMQEDLREVARNINRPAYRAAYNAPQAQNIWNEDLARLVQAPAVKSAIQPAMVKAQNKAVLGEAPEIAIPFRVDSSGNISMDTGQSHTLEFWDNVKQAMDDKIGALKRAGDSSWVDINKIKNKLVETLDKTVPQYSTARSGAAAMFGADNAFDAGMNFLGTRKALNAAQLKKVVERMKPNEREVFAHGVAADMLAKIKNKQERLDISKMFDSPEEREKIAMALGPERASQFEAFHRVENIMNRAYQSVVSNSMTAKRYLRAQEKGLPSKLMARLPYLGGEAGVAGAASGSFAGAFLPVFLDLGATTLKHLSETQRLNAMEKMGEMLVSPDPAVRQQILNMIAEKPSAMQKLRNIETSIRRAGVIGGVPEPRQERASGGRIGKRDYPAKKLSSLEKAARRALGGIAKDTTHIMDMPDEEVANALRMAK